VSHPSGGTTLAHAREAQSRGDGIALLNRLVARISRLAARCGRYRRAGPYLTTGLSPCQSKRTKIAVITSRSSDTE
jgi:hypothetical protein